jgi:hypothetical protein
MEWIIISAIAVFMLIVVGLVLLGNVFDTNLPIQLLLYFGAMLTLINGVSSIVTGIRKYYIYDSAVNPQFNLSAIHNNKKKHAKNILGGVAYVFMSIIAFYAIYDMGY